MKRFLVLLTMLISSLIAGGLSSQAADLTGGVMYAVPASAGGPVIDGNLSDWDLSGAEPVWVSAQTAASLHGSLALMYDATNLYVAAKIGMPGRLISNPNNPVDAYWNGDVLEFRLASDPSLPAPLDGSAPVKASDRIAHITMWKNSVLKTDYIAIGYGLNIDKGLSVNPAGSKIAIVEGPGGYTLEARIPWTALHVPGGVNPFAAGSRMTAVWGIIWIPEGRTAALYRENPGDFAFMQSHTWGQVEFSAKGNLAPRHETMEQALAVTAGKPVGVPITLDVPRAGKVSVNVFGPHGEVVRELTGGVEHEKGPMTVYWDGRDQWGFPLAPGKYSWGAYISPGLKAEYRGIFGKSGMPPYQTADGTGGWIGDHSGFADIAADATGFYAVCPIAESERSVIKIGYDEKTIWRRTPFVGGGWGPLYSMASNGKYLFLSFGLKTPKLVRLDAATGQTLVFTELGDTATMAPISDAGGATVPDGSAPFLTQPETSGLAATKTEVFASVFSTNIIQVLDAETGKPTRQLVCPSPRGLACDTRGNLYAISFAPDGASKLVRFDGGQGDAKTVIASGLVDPWHVALDSTGQFYVTQEGKSQQVAIFLPDGKPAGSIGRAGGRTWAGTYKTDAFLEPSGIAVDERGRLLVAETAIPRVISRYTTAPLHLEKQWYGSGAYWNADFPDPDDPLTGYYPFEPTGIGEARITSPDEPGAPIASWDLQRAGYDAFRDMYSSVASPEAKYLINHRKYMYSDTVHGICLVSGDQLLPVGSATIYNKDRSNNKLGYNYIAIWSDANGNHQVDPGEETIVDTIAGGPVPNMADATASMWMADNGDLYLTTQANEILKIPATKIDGNGTIYWAPDKASWCISPVIPSRLDWLPTNWRTGTLGVRVDTKGNLYTCYNATLPALDDKLAAKIAKQYPNAPRETWQAYATPELATSNHEGLGHTGESNAVKFAKFDSQGHLIWVAGRKATAAAGPGEMYHFWALAGMIGDDYVAAGSEWGQMYLYTHDGFFVDALFNNPGLAPPPGPYTFGGETAGSRIQYFKKQGQVWAYSEGMAYLVSGFDANGKVSGEKRISGTVALDKVYDSTPSAAVADKSMTIVPLAGTWDNIPSSNLTTAARPLAKAQIAYDSSNVYAHIHVNDATPLQNGADDLTLAFKGGDAVGLDLGPAGDRSQPGAGDIRLLAARIGGVDHLIAMKPVSTVKRVQEYYTPSGGRRHFDFVGDVPGGKAVLTPDADGKGYTADLTIPRSFIEIAIVPGQPLKGDVEVLLSGQGQRGLQATSRNYLFTPLRSETTMTDDIPTESWLYPGYWGSAAVK